MAGEAPPAIGSPAQLGLARIAYEQDHLAAAEEHVEHYLRLTRQLESAESFAAYAAFHARLRLAHGDVAGAGELLARAGTFIQARGFAFQAPLLAAVEVQVLLRQGKLGAAEALACAHDLPLARARVRLAEGDGAGALALLEPVRERAEARGWQDERLAALVLEALAHQALGRVEAAVRALDRALTAAAPGGLVRSFADEGAPMAQLLAAASRELSGHGLRVRAACGEAAQVGQAVVGGEALSARELEVLVLVAQGCSNHEIAERLVLALSTVKGHVMRIFEKMQVKRRKEAVARAREAGLL
jgi:LuxR family maltose regulon positive regulatory protein